MKPFCKLSHYVILFAPSLTGCSTFCDLEAVQLRGNGGHITNNSCTSADNVGFHSVGSYVPNSAPTLSYSFGVAVDDPSIDTVGVVNAAPSSEVDVVFAWADLPSYVTIARRSNIPISANTDIFDGHYVSPGTNAVGLLEMSAYMPRGGSDFGYLANVFNFDPSYFQLRIRGDRGNSQSIAGARYTILEWPEEIPVVVNTQFIRVDNNETHTISIPSNGTMTLVTPVAYFTGGAEEFWYHTVLNATDGELTFSAGGGNGSSLVSFKVWSLEFPEV